MSLSYWKSLLLREIHVYKGFFKGSAGKESRKFVLNHLKGNFDKAKKIIFKQHLKRRKTLKFEFHLTTHCNLNCKCCDTFSSIAPDGFTPLEQVKNDVNRLKEISDDKIDTLILAGGEPLLHPHLSEIMNIIGINLPEVPNKQIITNAVLLQQQDDDFWTSCKKNNFKLFITKYPINLPYDKITEKAKEKGVDLEFYGITGSSLKNMRKIPINIEGSENAKNSFKKCTRANNCITLKDGKFYTCSLIPRIDIFNNFFSKNLIVSDNDYIDLYQAKNIEEILGFLCKPVSFCRYCSTSKPVFGLAWEKTKKSLDEWI